MRSLFTLLLLAAPLQAQDALTLAGTDVTTVEVERQIIVRDKFQLVKTFPFTVRAPVGAVDYNWSLPFGVTATASEADAGQILTVTSAPVGRLTIMAKWIVVDFAAMTTARKSAKIEFIVGQIDPLAATLRGLYDADPSPDKAATLQTLAKVYRFASEAAKDPSILTAGVLIEALSRTLMSVPATSLQAMRARIGEELAKALPADDGPLDDATRKAIGAAYLRVAAALETMGAK